ncbi:MAG TPA: DUF4136 domain-containing protein [Thermoanaerobaculia bacterium]|jgi:hypothetical protein|nr:DUF4136 domain-containing protein [Thermoanaerobaculia bacterium]
MKIGAVPAILGALVLGLAGCASVTTSADYDRSTDFSKYRTYAWIENAEPIGNAIVQKRLTAAIDDQLAGKGLTKSDPPDLLVSMHARLTKQVEFETTGWGYGPGRWQTGIQTTRQEIPVGTLVVDLVDARAKELVWRGMARRILDLMASPEEKEKATRDTVAHMFAAYPPGR